MRSFWTGLTLAIALLMLNPVASHAKGGSIPPVNLIVPKEVREVIAEYFVLPEELLRKESDRVTFVRRAQREIPEILVTEGYFSSKVNLRSVSHAGVMEIEIIPGPRTLVTQVSIEFRGDLALPDTQRSERIRQLREAWTLPPGSTFRAPAWDDAKSNLLAQVARKDYAAARLAESSAQVDVSKASAKLQIVVDSGARFTFGEIKVQGLERYEAALVYRHADFKNGQPYERDLMMAFQNRLQNLPQFNSVIVNLDTANDNNRPDAADAEISAPVNVKIVEALSRKVSVGVGYSTNNGV
ncbi:MAG: outer membrane protein assembly factor, partial [Pseudomonadota bacterium]